MCFTTRRFVIYTVFMVYSYRPENDYNISISYNYMTYMNSIYFYKTYQRLYHNLQDNIQKLIK